jgi:hypothetical protein
MQMVLVHQSSFLRSDAWVREHTTHEGYMQVKGRKEERRRGRTVGSREQG